MGTKRYVFLDRDGTLVEDVGYGHREEDYHLLPGVTEALLRLRDAGYRFAIVTNQSGIGRGYFDHTDFERFQELLLADLAAAGIEVDQTYVCPHHPDDGCPCRKPAPGMLERARDELGADLSRSWMVGDSARDVGLAHNAGALGLLVLTGNGREEQSRLPADAAGRVVADLAAAADTILTWKQ